MSRECHKELNDGVSRKWDVDVMTGKANLEVRPTFINKGEIAKRLVNMYHDESGPSGKLELVLCAGDDTTDEDMFRSLNGYTGPVLDAENVFAVTVGASTKVTLARWHVLEPRDMIECVALLAGLDADGGLMKMGEVNLAAVSSVESHIPAEAET